jgi:hypothetical protein
MESSPESGWKTELPDLKKGKSGRLAAALDIRGITRLKYY